MKTELDYTEDEVDGSIGQEDSGEEDANYDADCDDAYDSDDPENWGPYYWSQGDAQSNNLPVLPQRIWDNVKYYSFKGYRNISFGGEVLAHFFGLNQSKYQWIIDLAESEAKEAEQEIIEAEQREEYKLQNKLKKDREKIQNLEEQ